MASRRPDSGVSVDEHAVVDHTNGNGNGRAAAPSAAPREPAVGELAIARLERANVALERENARLAAAAHGQSGAASAVRLTQAERRWRERAEAAERRAEQLSRQLATPRHRAVERARETAMRSRLVYPIVRRAWAWIARG
jgi:hypothetical protein